MSDQGEPKRGQWGNIFSDCPNYLHDREVNKSAGLPPPDTSKYWDTCTCEYHVNLRKEFDKPVLPQQPARGVGIDPITDQPDPTPNATRPVWEVVIQDMKDRDEHGRIRYGTPLQCFNGRDALVDAYQEALDLAVYLRQAILERDELRLQDRLSEVRGQLILLRDGNLHFGTPPVAPGSGHRSIIDLALQIIDRRRQ